MSLVVEMVSKRLLALKLIIVQVGEETKTLFIHQMRILYCVDTSCMHEHSIHSFT